jgi:hypothetical protein
MAGHEGTEMKQFEVVYSQDAAARFRMFIDAAAAARAGMLEGAMPQQTVRVVLEVDAPAIIVAFEDQQRHRSYLGAAITPAQRRLRAARHEVRNWMAQRVNDWSQPLPRPEDCPTWPELVEAEEEAKRDLAEFAE